MFLTNFPLWGNEYALELGGNYRYFANQYKQLADNLTPVKALSYLSQNRIEIERIKAEKERNLARYATPLLEEDTELTPLQICNISYSPSYSNENSLPQLGGIVDEEMVFKNAIRSFLKNEKSITSNQLLKLYDYTEGWFNISRKLEAIEMVISKVILNDYPCQIEDITSEEIEEKEVESKIGRPLDSSAPQDKIKEKVKELAQIKRFQNDDGTIKPTPIRDEIMNKYPDLMGDIKPRRLFDRVKKALKDLGMQ